ncbi:MAG: translation elongation factor-like protein [Candidatus Omnitrophica bacterium]|nr:translation elongation factor-like protein [Candidatus Omnitrophota bacterium]MDD5166194.1 translation elongation factor-like protein [Candidatus Omnitrophota bacterium]
MQEKEIGKITHYFGHIGVGIIELSDVLKAGDSIHIKGHSSDFTQAVDSIQIEHTSVPEAKAGDSVGIKVTQKIHPHDIVYKVTA